MIIQHNISAMNAHRQLTTNNSAVAKSLEKLSSGYRINRAGDDAAGLAISEKMRGQISGLKQASRNAQDGISLIQTAEGALNETHSILQRMRELSVQSANGTYDDKDRDQLNKEVSALKSEIDRISTSTEFNGKKLLDGSIGAGSVTMAGWDKATLNTKTTNSKIAISDVSGVSAKAGTTVTIAAGTIDTTNGLTVTTADAATGESKTVELDMTKLVKNTSDGTKNVAAGATFAAGESGVIDLSSVGLGRISFVATDASASTVANVAKDMIAGTPTAAATAGAGAGNTVTFQIGANGTEDQRVSLSVNNMSAAGIGVDTIDITSRDTANDAIATIDAAINTVSSTRADLGAVQNRMEHTINNLGVAKENLTASESRIRDVDMAEEMMSYTKNNILTQAAQAMLAQANTIPQGVLSLLK